MTKFLTSNEWQWRLARTIVQGILGVVVANIDVLVGAAVLDPAARAIVVALCMAVLSPVMAELGKHLDEADIDVPKGGDVDAAYRDSGRGPLVTFCEKVLIGQYNDADSVLEIHRALSKRILELEVEIEAIKRGASDSQAPENDSNADAEEVISPKNMVKILNRSCKFLKRSSDRLAKAMRTVNADKPALPPSTPDKTPEY